MKQFKVSFLLTVDDESGHPRKWIPDTLWPALRTSSGENIDDYVFEEVPVVEESPPVL